MTDNFIKGDRGVAGERGDRGDHGQDGRRGVQGEPGVPGTAGLTGRRGPGLRGADPRMIFLLIYTTVGMVFVFSVLGYAMQQANDKEHRFERQIVMNCAQSNVAAVKFNAFIDQAITNARNTIGLTPAQKKQAIRAESSLHQLIQKCPPKP